MTELNQYELSRIFGSQMKPVKQARFGNFGLLEVTAEALKSLHELHVDAAEGQRFGYEQDRVVVNAFEDVREGASTDALLWDRRLLKRFVRRCRELGLDAPAKTLNRRLINVRKNKRRYAEKGIVLSPTTRKEPKPSIVSQYAPIVEFALVRLRYRHGASIDDILLDPGLCQEYESFALRIAPALSDEALRRAALYIRKMRFIKKREQEEIRLLQLSILEHELTPALVLNEIEPQNIPAAPGLIEVDERDRRDRHLYVAKIKNLRALVQELRTGKPFQIVESPFWKPDLHAITIRYAPGERIGGIGAHKWERRLIRDFAPIFNWPIHRGQDMAA